MDSRLLERMLTGQVTLDNFLMAIIRHPSDDYDDQSGSRDVREVKERQNRARKHPKDEMCPILFGGASNPL